MNEYMNEIYISKYENHIYVYIHIIHVCVCITYMCI